MAMSYLITKKVFINTYRNIYNRYYCLYIQGQSPKPKFREYFYYIDHQGMLFLDDTKIKNFTSCLKDKKFLAFFFKRLRLNETDRYKEFPYISLCGKERNYIRCDDLPIVFTHILQNINSENNQIEDNLSYNYGNELLTIPFQPNKIIMSMKSGRVYHPAPEKLGGVGLVKSSLAIELSPFFIFEEGEENGPTKFNWKDKLYKIDNKWYTFKVQENNKKFN